MSKIKKCTKWFAMSVKWKIVKIIMKSNFSINLLNTGWITQIYLLLYRLHGIAFHIAIIEPRNALELELWNDRSNMIVWRRKYPILLL